MLRSNEHGLPQRYRPRCILSNWIFYRRKKKYAQKGIQYMRVFVPKEPITCSSTRK